MSIMKNLRKLEALAKTRYGSDISMLMSSHPAWGDDKMTIIVTGKKHAEVAADMMKTGANEMKIERSTAWEGSEAYDYAVVSYPTNGG